MIVNDLCNFFDSPSSGLFFFWGGVPPLLLLNFKSFLVSWIKVLYQRCVCKLFLPVCVFFFLFSVLKYLS